MAQGLPFSSLRTELESKYAGQKQRAANVIGIAMLIPNYV
jgi:hypothetical protein